MNIQRDTELLFEIGCFRYCQRTWKRFMNPDVANCAEHVFRVAWVALTLAKYEENIDTEKLLKFALVHDLPESRTGDVDYLSRLYTKRDEALGASDMFDGTVHEDMIGLLHEYEERTCIEAQLVKDADTLDVELELVEQEYRGHSMGTMWNEDRKARVYTKLYTETAKQFWDKIHSTDPNSWHLNGRNRLTSGDWKK